MWNQTFKSDYPSTHRTHFKLLRKEKYGFLNGEFLSTTFH